MKKLSYVSVVKNIVIAVSLTVAAVATWGITESTPPSIQAVGTALQAG